MDTNIATTRIAATTPQGAGTTGVAAQGNSLGGGNGVFSSMGGLSFIDMIFARITEGQDLKNETSGDATALLTPQADISAAGLLNQVLDSDIANLPEMTDTADLNAWTGLSDMPDASLATADEALPALSGQMQQLRDYLDTLLNGVPAEQRPQIVEIKPAEFKQILADLKAEVDAGNPALIATGLTPEKLSTLMAQVETAEKNGTLQSMIMVKIVAPEASAQDKPVPLLLPRALIAIQEQAQTGSDVAMSDGEADVMAAALNQLVVGGDESAHVSAEVVARKVNTISTMPGGMSAEGTADIHAATKDVSADDEGHAKISKDDGKNIPSGVEKAAEKIKNAVSAGLSSIMNSAPGSIETATNWADGYTDGMDMTTGLGLAAKPLGATAAAMTSVSTSAQSATYPHPATQAVAATISKNAAATEDKAFTIKLDPPELGRVEVKMAIDKNNAVKAHLIIEKPETFMMLQRDAQILERSLQGLGMDTGDGGISFELAQDNMFQNEGDRGGERYQTGKGTAAIETIDEEIETTMTWHVDPQTGMQRYNILA